MTLCFNLEAEISGQNRGQNHSGESCDLLQKRPRATCVKADVVAQGGGLAEAAVAELADERLVQGVDAHVGAQVAARVEAAAAHHAVQPPGRTGLVVCAGYVVCGEKGH